MYKCIAYLIGADKRVFTILSHTSGQFVLSEGLTGFSQPVPHKEIMRGTLEDVCIASVLHGFTLVDAKGQPIT